jgi:O-antigen/teichoic acid export membrane protein
LEANQRFDLVSKVRIPLGIFTFAAPLLVARYFSNNLADVALMLVVGRIAFLILTMWLCIKITPKLFPPLGIQLNLLKSLFSFGSWMTLTNLIGPMMVYLDRFVIGSLISMTAVAYYVTPYEVITKLWILPGALTGVLFSAFAINLVNHVERTVNQFRNAMDGIFLLMLPITMLAIVFANDGLTLWLGQDFADHSVLVFQILAIGVLINSLGRVPFVFIQAAGRPDIPARLHLLELPLYLFALWYMLEKWGVAGASIAWVLRIVLDNLVLFAGCVRIVPLLKSVMWRGIAMSTLPCLVLVQEIMVAGRIEKISVIIVAIVIIIASSWWFSNHWRGKFKLYAEAKDD